MKERMPIKIYVAERKSNEYEELGEIGMKFFFIATILLLFSFALFFFLFISFYFLILILGLYTTSLLLYGYLPKIDKYYKNKEGKTED